MNEPEILEKNSGSGNSRSSWVVASTSCAFVLICLYLGEQISKGYYFASLQQGFKRYLSASKDLVFAIDNPEFQELFEAEEYQLKTLKPLISLISQKDLKRASAYLKKQSLPNNPLSVQLGNTLSELNDLEGKSGAAEEEIQSLRGAILKQAEQYIQLKADFRSKLGNEVKGRPQLIEGTTQVGDESATCSFYNEGILQDLPLLNSLPAEVKDLESLSSYFSFAKNGEKPPSPQAAEALLKQLQERGRQLKNDCANNIQKQKDLETSKHKITEKRKELLDHTQATIEKILLNCAKPELEKPTVLIYDLFSASLLKLGVKLPSLMV